MPHARVAIRTHVGSVACSMMPNYSLAEYLWAGIFIRQFHLVAHVCELHWPNTLNF